MGFNDILKALFGNKSTRDLKKLVPMVDKIKAVYPEIEKLSNDELRARIDEVRSRLKKLHLIFDPGRVERYGVSAYMTEDGDDD